MSRMCRLPPLLLAAALAFIAFTAGFASAQGAEVVIIPGLGQVRKQQTRILTIYITHKRLETTRYTNFVIYTFGFNLWLWPKLRSMPLYASFYCSSFTF